MRDGSSAAACASGEWDGPPKKFAGAREEQFQGTRGARVIPALKLGWSASYPPRGCHPDGASAQRGAADRAARPTRSVVGLETAGSASPQTPCSSLWCSSRSRSFSRARRTPA